jgi:hypothetical protein
MAFPSRGASSDGVWDMVLSSASERKSETDSASAGVIASSTISDRLTAAAKCHGFVDVKSEIR